jgi:hypothetical protein
MNYVYIYIVCVMFFGCGTDFVPWTLSYRCVSLFSLVVLGFIQNSTDKHNIKLFGFIHKNQIHNNHGDNASAPYI